MEHPSVITIRWTRRKDGGEETRMRHSPFQTLERSEQKPAAKTPARSPEDTKGVKENLEGEKKNTLEKHNSEEKEKAGRGHEFCRLQFTNRSNLRKGEEPGDFRRREKNQNRRERGKVCVCPCGRERWKRSFRNIDESWHPGSGIAAFCFSF